jgi:hypothetical protein
MGCFTFLKILQWRLRKCKEFYDILTFLLIICIFGSQNGKYGFVIIGAKQFWENSCEKS